MRQGGNIESSAAIRARANTATAYELQHMRRVANDRVKTFEHNVIWPALADSWRADLAHIDAVIAGRGHV